MRLRHLEVFHTIMQTGSVSKAADLLGVSQPAASKMLMHAEQNLGMVLFKRSPGKIKPTREAYLLFDETKVLYSHLENIRRLSRNMAYNFDGYLRIGCVPSLGLYAIPKIIADFSKKHKNVGINVQTCYTESFSSLLLSRELDLAVAFEGQYKAGVKSILVGKTKIVYIEPTNEETAHKSVNLDELTSEGYIGTRGIDPIGAIIERNRRILGMPDLLSVIEVRSCYLARSLVYNGLGYALIDEFTAKAEGPPLNVRHLIPEVPIDIYVLTAENAPESRARDIFINKIKHYFSSLQSKMA